MQENIFDYVKYSNETVNRMKEGRIHESTLHMILEGKETQGDLGDDG
jgi:hypothetical protein